MLRRFYERARALWLRALHEHATPREIGWSVAVGVFVGCSPLLGFHMWIALGLATLFRLNRVWALVGSRISFVLTSPGIFLTEIQVAHRLRTGEWAQLAWREVMGRAREYLLDWTLGFFPVGAAIALVVGSLAYLVARRRARLTPRTPSRSLPPTSESPP